MHATRASLLLLLVWTCEGSAAPPTLTGFFPAGGQRGTTITTTVQGKTAPWPVQLWSESKQIQIKPLKESGQVQITIAPDAVPGAQWIRLTNAEGASELRPFQIGMLKEVTEKELNNDYRKPQGVEGNVTLNGQLNPRGDVDCFAVKLKQGQTLIATLHANETLLSPMDAILQVLSTSGNLLATNHDTHGLDPQIRFSAPKDGSYIVRLFCFPATPNSTIGFAGGNDYIYRLTLTTGPYIEQVYPLALQKGKSTPVAAMGWNLTKAMEKLAPTDNILFHPQAAGAAALQWEPHAAWTEEQAKKQKVIDTPATITGAIGVKGEQDVWSIRARKKERLQIEVESRAVGSVMDPLLEVLDKDKVLLRADDIGSRRNGNRDARGLWTSPADGIYQIRIRDLYGHGGQFYLYRLRITKPAPDYSLSSAKNQFTASFKKPLEIPVSIARAHGFREKITLTVTGLPPGASCMPVVSEPKGATAKSVKLKLQPGGKPFSGPVQIIGTVAKQDLLKRIAAAPVAGSSIKTQHLWLTIKK